MIAVDTSALVAVVLGEVNAEPLLEALQRDRAVTSAVSIVEATMVVEARHGPDGTRDLELLIGGVIDEVRAVDRAMADVALDAWRRFGKGRHPAALNFGDCFAYAVAAVDAVPLLFVGHDFGQTDVAVATY